MPKTKELKKEKFLLKDHLFNRSKIEKIAHEIYKVYPDFNKTYFLQTVLNKFPELELKQRIYWIRDVLKECLPFDFRKAATILVKSLPPENDNTKADNDFGDFIYAPYADFIAQSGCTAKDLDFSLNALHAITMRFSVEDAIRYFINAFPEKTMKHLQNWSKDRHYHVRRLASEGTRPKLPWCQKIQIPVESAIPILDNLYADKTRFVTRSVANHINDISKTNPALVLKTLSKWKNSKKQDAKEMDYIIRHSLRSLIKAGHKDTLLFLNYAPDAKISVSNFKLKRKKIKLDDELEFEFSVSSKSSLKLMIDYTLYFRDKSGTKFNSKVFKLKNIEISKETIVNISKKHRMSSNMTTRKLYPGKHHIELQLNGKKMGKLEFELLK
jgi:3-methyladenine DNA glycosylase AlkC